MSSDKRKKFRRACELLREVNTSHYHGPWINGRGRFSLKNPTLRYILKRGMATLKRVKWSDSRNGLYDLRRTKIDTGVPWARGK